MRYLLRLEDRQGFNDGTIGALRLELEGNELSCLISGIISRLLVGRHDQLVSELVLEALEGYDIGELWPGYNDALDRLHQAAQDIVDGWNQNDRKLDAAARGLKAPS